MSDKNPQDMLYALVYEHPDGIRHKAKTWDSRAKAFAQVKSEAAKREAANQNQKTVLKPATSTQYKRYMVAYRLEEEKRWDWDELVDAYAPIFRMGINHGRDVKLFLNNLDNRGQLTADITLIVFENAEDCKSAHSLIKSEDITIRRSKKIMGIWGGDVDHAVTSIDLSFNARVINSAFSGSLQEYHAGHKQA